MRRNLKNMSLLKDYFNYPGRHKPCSWRYREDKSHSSRNGTCKQPCFFGMDKNMFLRWPKGNYSEKLGHQNCSALRHLVSWNLFTASTFHLCDPKQAGFLSVVPILSGWFLALPPALPSDLPGLCSTFQPSPMSCVLCFQRCHEFNLPKKPGSQHWVQRVSVVAWTDETASWNHRMVWI